VTEPEFWEITDRGVNFDYASVAPASSRCTGKRTTGKMPVPLKKDSWAFVAPPRISQAVRKEGGPAMSNRYWATEGWTVGTAVKSDEYGAPVAPPWREFWLLICISLAVAAPGVYVFFHGGMDSFTATWLQVGARLLELVSVAAGLLVAVILLTLIGFASDHAQVWWAYFRYRDERSLALARRLLELDHEAAQQFLTNEEKARLIRESAGAKPGEKVFFYLSPEAQLSVGRADGVIFCSHYLYNPRPIFREPGNERREGFQIRIFSLSKQHEISSQALLDQVISRSLLDQMFFSDPYPVAEDDSAKPTSEERKALAGFLFRRSRSIDMLLDSEVPEVLNRLIRIITDGKEIQRDVPSWEREDFRRLKRAWQKHR